MSTFTHIFHRGGMPAANCMVAVLLLFSVSLQGQFQISYPAPAQSVPVCLGNSALTVRLDVSATGVNPTVAIDLPPGISYVAGSVSRTSGTIGSITESNIGNLNIPVFSLSSANFGEFIVFSIRREAKNCEARTFALGPPPGVFKDIVSASSIAGGVLQTATENNPNVNSYGLLSPSVSLTPQGALTAVVGQTISRDITISNGGFGPLDVFTFSITEQVGGLTTTSLTTQPNGTVLTPVSTTVSGSSRMITYNIPGSVMSEFGDADMLFENGENILVRRTYRVESCDVASSYIANWGCGGQTCQNVTAPQQTNLAVGVGNLSGFTWNLAPGYVNMCATANGGLVDIVATYTWTGTGNNVAASALNAILRVGGSTQTTSLTAIQSGIYNSVGNVRINGNPVASTYSGGILSIQLNNTFSSDPDGPGGLSDMDGDGYFDDIAPGATVSITYSVSFNCTLGCNSTINTNANFAGDVIYNQMCGTQSTTNRVNGQGPFSRASISPNGYMPANITNGLPFRVRLSTGWQSYSSPFRTSGTRFIWEVDLPAGFSVAGTGNPAWTNGQYFNTNLPASVSYQLTGNTLRIISPTSTTPGWAEIDLVYDCAAGGNVSNFTLPYRLLEVNDISGATPCNCMEQVVCGTLSAATLCPGSCPAGPVNYIPVVRRTDYSLGWTDGSMAVRQSAANISTYDLSKALYLDTIQISGSARQSGPSNSLGLRLELSRSSNTNRLTSLEIYCEIWRGGTLQSSGTFSSAFDAGSAGNVQRIGWNLDAVLPAGGLLHNDSIYAVSRYWVSNNSTLPTNDIQTGVRWYYYNFNPLATPQEVRCNEFVPEMYLVGTASLNGSNTYNTESCTPNALGGSTNFLARRFNTAGVVYLNEFRPGLYVDSIVSVVPPGYEFVEALFTYTSAYNTPSYSIVVPPTSVVGNTYSFVNPGSGPNAWKPLGITVTNTYGATFRVTVRPTCTTLPVENIVHRVYIKDYYYALAGSNPYPPAQQGNLLGKTNAINHSQKGNLTLTDQTGLLQTVSPQQSWTIRIANNGLGVTPYIWLAIPTQNTIQVLQLVNLSTNMPVAPIPYAGGMWYQLSAAGLASGASANYRIDFSYTSCTQDALRILSGWNCGGFPTDPASAPCTSQLLLRHEPLQSEVQLQLDQEPTVPVAACSPFQYVLTVNSAQSANLMNVVFDMELPQGLALSGNFEAEYPKGSGNWSVIANTGTARSPSFDLTTHPAYPLSGLPGLVLNPGTMGRQICLRFSVESDCNFSPGSVIDFQVFADRPCGVPAVGNELLLTSSAVRIVGVNLTYFIGTDSDMAAPVLGCVTPSELSVRHTIGGTGTTNATDQILITLPAGVNYSGNLSCVANCPVFVSNSLQLDGTRALVFALPAGLTVGAVIEYRIGIVGEGFANCGANRLIRIQTNTLVPGPLCGTVQCADVRAVTGTKTLFAVVDKPQFAISAFSTTAFVPATGAAITYQVALTVRNTASLASLTAGQTVAVEFFCGDGAGNPVGNPIGAALINGPLAPGASTGVNASFIAGCGLSNGIVAVINGTTHAAATAPAIPNMQQCICAATAPASSAMLWCYTIQTMQPNDQTACQSKTPASAVFTTQNAIADGIRFVYFTGTIPANPYAGGTFIATGTGNGASVTLPGNLLPNTPGVNYIYALQNPLSPDANCRPASLYLLTILGVDCGSFPWNGN